MFFDRLDEIEKLALNAGASLFVVPNPEKVQIKNALTLKPEEDAELITMTQVHELEEFLNVKIKTPRFILISPAEKLNDEAVSAFMKNLEEPRENYHFILLSQVLDLVPSAIASRSAIYFLRTKPLFEQELGTNEKTIALTRDFLSAQSIELPKIADKIASKSGDATEKSLTVLETGIKMLFCDLLKDPNIETSNRLAKVVETHENIANGGTPKLHLVADMI